MTENQLHTMSITRRTVRPNQLIALLGTALMATTLVAGCGNSGTSTAASTTSSTSPTGAASGGGSNQGSTSTSTSSTPTSSTPASNTVPTGAASGSCPVGRFRLESPGTGLPIQITSGGTGVVVEVGSDDRVRISFDDYASASGTARGGSFTISATGSITARLEPVPGADNQYRLTDVDGSGVTGEERISIDGGEPIVIAGAEFTELIGSLGGVGAGATLSCSPSGDLVASAGPISQTYVRS